MSDPMGQFKTIFFEECSELLTSLEEGLMQLQAGNSDEETLHATFRAVHSIKGGAGAFGFDRLVAFAHIQETLLDDIRSGALEMEPDYLDVLLQAYDILGGLVGAAQRADDVDENYGQDVALAMKAIMEKTGVPVSEQTSKLPAEKPEETRTSHFKISFKPYVELYQRANEPILLIRELGELGQLTVDLNAAELPDIEDMDAEHAYFSWTFRLVMSGEETEVDKTVTERIGDPLMHMIRNSLDHGLESPEDRVKAGKDAEGTVHLSAFHRGGRIFIEIEDDGMDVVRKNIQSLGGRISIRSITGQGSKFTMSLPLTLAVMDGMVVDIGSEKYVLPLVNIIQTLRPTANDVNRLPDGRKVMIYFDQETQDKLVRRYADCLKPDGILFIGHSESLLSASDIYKCVGKTTYRLLPCPRAPG